MESKEKEVNIERYIISSIDKALDVIEALAKYENLSLIELSEILNRPKSSVYRIVLTLENRGFVTHNKKDSKYCLGYKQIIITRKLLERNTLRSCAIPEMKWLSNKYGDTVNLGILNEGLVLYMEVIEGTNSLRMNESVGSTSPFHATAIGMSLVSFLPEENIQQLVNESELTAITPFTVTDKAKLLDRLREVKNNGFAIENQEIVHGASCIAAPILGRLGQVEGAVSISGATHRFSIDQIPIIIQDLIKVANNISRELGYKL